MAALVSAAVRAATGHPFRSILEIHGGYSHRTFRVEVEGRSEAVALRFPTRDPASCQREEGVLKLAGNAVPVPDVVFVDVTGAQVGHPVIVSRWVDGIALDAAIRHAGRAEARDLGRRVGGVIACLSQVRLSRPGWLTDSATVEPRSRSLAAGLLAHVRDRLFETEGGRRLPSTARDHLWSTIRQAAPALSDLDECASLVHGDLAGRNILVSGNAKGWQVSAVLDWEFASSGPSLLDVGHILRHWRSQPPEFEDAMVGQMRDDGMVLPDGWRRLAWLLDAVSLTGPLAQPQGHPDRVVASTLITGMVLSRHPWERP